MAVLAGAEARRLMDVLSTVGSSLEEAFFMFWETLWALVLGFGLSGAVQSFVSRREMQRAMGDRRPLTVARTSLLGAASSSCSYAASALARTLFGRGADFTTAMVFMFASTNLVVELGLVLWLLIGWQFAVAEFVGGAIMIALLTIALPRMVPRRMVEAARARSERSGRAGEAGADQADQPPLWRERLRSPGGWADAAGYAIADLTMLRREMLIGYVVAGFLALGVPASFWRHLFLTGHGFWTVLENVVLGPFIALISFVCSVGNVPLAAALWQDGISFGGTIAFVFGDLIALPLLLIYRKFYGGALTWRLLGAFWLVMSLAGLATEYLFNAAGILPATRPAIVVHEGFRLDHTLWLNFAALLAFAGIWWLHRHRERFGGGAGYATDPVCGMQVEKANAPATARHDGETLYFCSDRCRERFATDPERFAGSGDTTEPMATDEHGQLRDPVCGMAVDPDAAAATL